MADTFSLSDFLQGRLNPYLSQWWAVPPAYPTSEFTTPADLTRERLSKAWGWDVGHPGMEFMRRLLTEVPMGMRSPVGADVMWAARTPDQIMGGRPDGYAASLRPSLMSPEARFRANQEGRSLMDYPPANRGGYEAEAWALGEGPPPPGSAAEAMFGQRPLRPGDMARIRREFGLPNELKPVDPGETKGAGLLGWPNPGYPPQY